MDSLAVYWSLSDPAKQANHQVLEALQAAVATVVQYDEWDEALLMSRLASTHT